ncbi:hypothetical protein PQZ39_00580 [bacterium]|nr:hypothetical protein [bacterium]
MKSTFIILLTSLILIACNQSEKQFSDYITADNIESIEFQGADMELRNTEEGKSTFLNQLSEASLSSIKNIKEGSHFFNIRLKNNPNLYTAKINNNFVAIDARLFGDKAAELKSDSLQFEIVWELN